MRKNEAENPIFLRDSVSELHGHPEICGKKVVNRKCHCTDTDLTETGKTRFQYGLQMLKLAEVFTCFPI
jgi:hypothetical protein